MGIKKDINNKIICRDLKFLGQIVKKASLSNLTLTKHIESRRGIGAQRKPPWLLYVNEWKMGKRGKPVCTAGNIEQSY